MISWLVASLAFGFGAPAQEEVNWVRTFKDKERVGYHIKMTLDRPAARLEADLGVRTLLVKGEGKADIQMGGSNIMGDFPLGGNPSETNVETLKSSVTRHGLPDKIAFELGKATFMYAFLSAAGVTADKRVKVGDSFKVSWANSAKTLMLEGEGKVLEISPPEKTLKFEITYAIDTKGAKGASFTYKTTSVSRTDDGSLVSSSGSVLMEPLEWKIEITREK